MLIYSSRKELGRSLKQIKSQKAGCFVVEGFYMNWEESFVVQSIRLKSDSKFMLIVITWLKGRDKRRYEAA